MSFIRIAAVAVASLCAAPVLAAPAGAWRAPAAVHPVPSSHHVGVPRGPGRVVAMGHRPFGPGHAARRVWTSFGPTGWTTVAPSMVVVFPAGALPGRPVRPVLPTSADLPTAADLPVVNIVREPADPALFYVINDLSRGRSLRPGGARIVSAGPALPMGHAPGGTPSDSGPRIIELTAR